MKNSTTSILSLVGGMVLGSAITICWAHKSGHIKADAIHNKIIAQVDELKNSLMEHIASVKCNCDDKPATNPQN